MIVLSQRMASTCCGMLVGCFGRLESELKTRKISDPELALHLHADEGVNYGIVAKVMSGIERAGVTKLSVLTIAQ